MNEFIDWINNALSSEGLERQIINFALGVAALLIGWLVALFASYLTRMILSKTRLDEKIGELISGDDTNRGLRIDFWISQAVFYIILLFSLVAALDLFNLPQISEPLNNVLDKILSFIPNILGFLGITGIALLLAKVAKGITKRVVASTNLEEKMQTEMDYKGDSQQLLYKNVPDTIYWIVILLFLPLMLEALSLEGALKPVQDVFSGFASYIPNIIGAAVLFVLGGFIANIVKKVVKNLSVSFGIDQVGARVGLNRVFGTTQLSDIVANLVYGFILLNIGIAALESLDIAALTQPMLTVLNKIYGILPEVLSATAILIFAYMIGRPIADYVANFLKGMGVDNIAGRMGISMSMPKSGQVQVSQQSAKGTQVQSGQSTVSDYLGNFVFLIIMLFAALEAFNLVGLEMISNILENFVAYSGQIVSGLLIFGIGIYIANWAFKTISASTVAQSGLLANLARFGILLLTVSMALREMNIANEIVTLAFGLTLGAVAVAAAIAFGLGGREVAGEVLADARNRMK